MKDDNLLVTFFNQPHRWFRDDRNRMVFLRPVANTFERAPVALYLQGEERVFYNSTITIHEYNFGTQLLWTELPGWEAPPQKEWENGYELMTRALEKHIESVTFQKASRD